jgi:hypothetical protein
LTWPALVLLMWTEDISTRVNNLSRGSCLSWNNVNRVQSIIQHYAKFPLLRRGY